MTEPEEELEFPLICCYRVIAHDREGIQEDLQKALLSIGVDRTLSEGNKSSKGTYLTFFFEVKVNSKERMSKIDEALRNVDGVKMVL